MVLAPVILRPGAGSRDYEINDENRRRGLCHFDLDVRSVAASCLREVEGFTGVIEAK